MATIPNIPDWFIAKAVRPGGVRLPKRKKYEEPPQPRYGFLGRMRQENSIIGSGPTPGEKLSYGDLRYWVGYDSPLANPAYAACRACGEVHTTAKERKEHSRKWGCGRLLTEAFKLLLRDRICVVCNEPTRKQTWGMPICSEECKKEWSYVTRCPDSLHQAIELAKTWLKNEGITL